MLVTLVLFFVPKPLAVSSSPSKGRESGDGTGHQEDTPGKGEAGPEGPYKVSEIFTTHPPAMINGRGTHAEHGTQVIPQEPLPVHGDIWKQPSIKNLSNSYIRVQEASSLRMPHQ